MRVIKKEIIRGCVQRAQVKKHHMGWSDNVLTGRCYE